MLAQLLGLVWSAAALEVVGAGEEPEIVVGELVCDQGGVGKVARADRDVVTLLDEIDGAIAELQLDLNFRIGVKKCAYDGWDTLHLQWSGDAQSPARRVLYLGDPALGFGEILGDAGAGVVVDAAGVGEAQLARGPAQELYAEAILETSDATADGGGR